MQLLVEVENSLEMKEHVKDHYGQWICEGMYVNSVERSSGRQGWIVKIIDIYNDIGKIQVQIARDESGFYDEDSFYLTGFELSTNWYKA